MGEQGRPQCGSDMSHDKKEPPLQSSGIYLYAIGTDPKWGDKI